MKSTDWRSSNFQILVFGDVAVLQKPAGLLLWRKRGASYPGLLLLDSLNKFGSLVHKIVISGF